MTQADFLLRKTKAPEHETGTVVRPNDFHVTNRLETVRPYVRCRTQATATSLDAPEWFSVATIGDVTKAPGYDGTLTLLSRINGWITVTPKAKDRSRRVGRHGPFDQSKKKYDLHTVSDLTPAWMQTQGRKPEGDQFKTAGGYSSLREVGSTQGQKRVFLVDAKPPEKSQFSIGDFRHNVRTSEEAQKYMSEASPVPKNLLQWTEAPGQRYDKPITSKIGSLP